MTWEPMCAGEGELLEETRHALLVLAFVRVDLGIGTLQVGGAQHPRGAVAGAGDENHVQVVAADQPVEVCPDEGQGWTGAPVPQQSTLDVVGPQGLAQQGVGAQVDHADRQVVAGLPPAVDELQLGVGRCSHCFVCRHVCTRSRGGCSLNGRAIAGGDPAGIEP